ncbi:MAG: hypothetical protein M4D80_26735 [Myxococcota bacterium]|nr:hypothetical protein [Deltaproteobacteria bacterium]MDQ3338779.1 hypothetical protein [Myxococcota bacterium]
MRWLIVVGLFVGALVWLWQSTREAPMTAERDAAQPASPVTTTKRRTLTPTAPVARLTLPPREGTFDAASHHTADPCTALSEPIIPATFEQTTAAGITIAWDPTKAPGPYDAPFRPVSLAYTVAGLLEEAAQLTGTDRRERLAVIVDASSEDFLARTKAPTWAGGLYDGSAVHLPPYARADFGVAMTSLRHEVMHAQMHAVVGCTPFWFNEGLANYFAGATPTKEWVAMARTGEPFDLTTLREPAIHDVKAQNAHRMYAVSTAMLLYIVHRAGEVGIREAVRSAQSAPTIPAALDLWTRMAPNVEYRMVLDSLALRIFGVPRGPELDVMLESPLCCLNMRSPADLTCRPPNPEKPREICRRW